MRLRLAKRRPRLPGQPKSGFRRTYELRGVPFRFDDTLRMTYEGDLLGLLNPFAFLCGCVSCATLVTHGGADEASGG
jgi:hypothetical protein